MAQYRMKIRRTTEEIETFTMEADSDVHAHKLIEENLPDIKWHPAVQKSARTTVIECHRVRTED